MKVDVIVPVHSSSVKNVTRLLDSIAEAETSNLGQVILVFNPEFPPDFKWDKRWSFARFLGVSETANVNCARNLGMLHATSELILFIDSDCEVREKNIFNKIINIVKSMPEFAIFGGRYLPPRHQSFLSQSYYYLQSNWLSSGQQKDGLNYQLLGGCLVVRNSFARKLEWDEEISFGGSEAGFLAKAKSLGIKAKFESSIGVKNSPCINAWQLARRAFLQGRNAIDLVPLVDRQITLEFFELENQERRSRWLKFGVAYYRLLFSMGQRQSQVHKSPRPMNEIYKILKLPFFYFFRKIYYKVKTLELSCKNLVRGINDVQKNSM